jgi:hypothetical protein
MRYLLCTALLLAACERRDAAVRDTAATDTLTLRATPDRAMSAVPDRLLGTWTAQGYDAGSNRAQQFTITWTRAPDGSLVGNIAFRPGEAYKVAKVVFTADTTIVYESELHRSPTLNAQVVTRTEARFVGDSLVGTYAARATTGGKVLRGRFTAKRSSAP